MSSSDNRVRFGSYTADTNARTIDTLSFQPKVVVVQNEASTFDMVYWQEGMDDDAAFLTTGTTGVRSVLTSGGITVGTNETNNFGSFTIGTGGAIQAAGKVRWTAYE